MSCQVKFCSQKLIEIPGDDPVDVAEERRLFFVAMTRARRELIITHTRRRMWRGARKPMKPSPFLRDIDTELRDHVRHEGKPRAAGPRYRQLELFDP